MTFLDRLLGRPAQKAVYGGPYLTSLSTGVPLSVLASTPQERAAKYLQAYKVGWFYKAGRKISIDVGGLAFSLSYEDTEGDNADTITAAATSFPFDSLDPLEQFLRLMERPNGYQTGRQLFEKTQIRLDFAGSAFWYLENGAGGQLPTAIYGISPTRMWPSLDAQNNLVGWVMDADKPSGGVPFEVEEILPFTNTTATDDPWAGQGVVEAVYAQVPLTDLMARHNADVLTTGGRLAGMLSPKTRTLSENEYQDTIKAWRNVASDANAARRLLVFPEPMEWVSGAASPKDIGIPELANLTRDEILTAFPISPYQLGVPMPGGLNSAETRREDRRDYWEGSIHPRVEILEETIQVGLVGRYEAIMGRPLDFDIEEPNLDDAPTLIEKVGALKGLVSSGFDPKEAVSAVGLDHIKWNGLPALMDPAQQAQMAAQAAEAPKDTTQVSVRDTTNRDNAVTVQEVSGKASGRELVVDRAVSGAVPRLEEFLREQRERVISSVTDIWTKTKKAERKAVPPDWWDAASEDALLADALSYLYRDVARGSLQVVANQLERVVVKNQHLPIAEDILAKGGTRITGINETTRQAINDLLKTAVDRGYSISQIVDGVGGTENFPGLRNLLLDNGQQAWADLRAETIARTETGYAYNQAALGGYKTLGVRQVRVYDGDKDDICAPWDGWVGPVDEAPEALGHPNCTRDFAPAGYDKAWSGGWTPDDVATVIKSLPMPALTINNAPPSVEAPITINTPEPVVNVEAPVIHNEVAVPEVTVEAAQITVEPTPVTIDVKAPDVTVTNEVQTPYVKVDAPNVTVTNDVQTPVVNVQNDFQAPAIKAEPQITVTVPAELSIVSMPDRVTKRKVSRDSRGAISETTDVETDA